MSLEPVAKRSRVFDDPAIDALVAMLLELAREQWVTRARLAALEHRVGSVEALELPAEVEATLAAERAAFIKRLFAVLERD